MSLVKILLLLMLVCGAKSECGVRRKNCVKTGANAYDAYVQYRIVPDRSCPMNNQGSTCVVANKYEFANPFFNYAFTSKWCSAFNAAISEQWCSGSSCYPTKCKCYPERYKDPSKNMCQTIHGIEDIDGNAKPLTAVYASGDFNANQAIDHDNDGGHWSGGDYLYRCVKPKCDDGYYQKFPRKWGTIAYCTVSSTTQVTLDYDVYCAPCQSCPAGQYRTGCVSDIADEGWDTNPSPDPSGTCANCPSGEYKPNSGNWATPCSSCESCDPGKYRSGCGDTSEGSCVSCPEGKYKSAALSWDTQCSSCEPCPPGSYKDGCGGTSAGNCVACESGKFKIDTGSWSTGCTACETCAAGKYRYACGGSSRGSCPDCTSGTYKKGDGSGLCSPCEHCPAGQYRSNCGLHLSGTCEPCQAGKFKTENASWDTPCSDCGSECADPSKTLLECGASDAGVCVREIVYPSDVNNTVYGNWRNYEDRRYFGAQHFMDLPQKDDVRNVDPQNKRPLQLASSIARDLSSGQTINNTDDGYLRYYIDQRSFRVIFRYAKYDNNNDKTLFQTELGLVPFRDLDEDYGIMHMMCEWDKTWSFLLQKCLPLISSFDTNYLGVDSQPVAARRRLLQTSSTTCDEGQKWNVNLQMCVADDYNENTDVAYKMPILTWEPDRFYDSNTLMEERFVPCTLALGCFENLTSATGGQVYIPFAGNLSQCPQNSASYCETAVKKQFAKINGACIQNAVEVLPDACQCRAAYKYDQGQCQPCAHGEYAYAFDGYLEDLDYTIEKDICVACIRPVCLPGFYVFFPTFGAGIATCERDSLLSRPYNASDAVRCVQCEKGKINVNQSETCVSCQLGYTSNSQNTECVDINECPPDQDNPCWPDASCENTPGSFQCKCNSGFWLEPENRSSCVACDTAQCPANESLTGCQDDSPGSCGQCPDSPLNTDGVIWNENLTCTWTCDTQNDFYMWQQSDYKVCRKCLQCQDASYVRTNCTEAAQCVPCAFRDILLQRGATFSNQFVSQQQATNDTYGGCVFTCPSENTLPQHALYVPDQIGGFSLQLCKWVCQYPYVRSQNNQCVLCGHEACGSGAFWNATSADPYGDFQFECNETNATVHRDNLAETMQDLFCASCEAFLLETVPNVDTRNVIFTGSSCAYTCQIQANSYGAFQRAHYYTQEEFYSPPCRWGCPAGEMLNAAGQCVPCDHRYACQNASLYYPDQQCDVFASFENCASCQFQLSEYESIGWPPEQEYGQLWGQQACAYQKICTRGLDANTNDCIECDIYCGLSSYFKRGSICTSQLGCKTCTVCNPQTQAVQAPCTQFDDTLCRDCVICDPQKEYYATPCNAASPGVCQPCAQTCPQGYYISTPCGVDTHRDIVCTECQQGFWCDGIDQIQCPENSTSPNATAEISDCLCESEHHVIFSKDTAVCEHQVPLLPPLRSKQTEGLHDTCAQVCDTNYYVNAKQCDPCPSTSSSPGGKGYMDSCVCQAGHFRNTFGTLDFFQCQQCRSYCSDAQTGPLGRRKQDCQGDEWNDTLCECVPPPNVILAKFNWETCAVTPQACVNPFFFQDTDVSEKMYAIYDQSEESRVYSKQIEVQAFDVQNPDFSSTVHAFVSNDLDKTLFFFTQSKLYQFSSNTNDEPKDITQTLWQGGTQIFAFQIKVDNSVKFDRFFFSAGASIYKSRLYQNGNFGTLYEIFKGDPVIIQNVRDFYCGEGAIFLWDASTNDMYQVPNFDFAATQTSQQTPEFMKMVTGFDSFVASKSSDSAVLYIQQSTLHMLQKNKQDGWQDMVEYFNPVLDLGHDGKIKNAVLVSDNVCFYLTDDGKMWMFDLLQQYVRPWQPQTITHQASVVKTLWTNHAEDAAYVVFEEADAQKWAKIDLLKCGTGLISSRKCGYENGECTDSSECVQLPCYREFMCDLFRDGEDCTCIDGYMESNDGECVPCASGGYCKKGIYTQCPSESTSLPKSHDDTHCFCKAGYAFSQDEQKCVTCPNNKYCHGSFFQALSTQNTCPIEHVSETQGKKWKGDCECNEQEGYFLDKNLQCVQCQTATGCSVQDVTPNAEIRYVVARVLTSWNSTQAVSNAFQNDFNEAQNQLPFFENVQCDIERIVLENANNAHLFDFYHPMPLQEKKLYERICVFDFSDKLSGKTDTLDKATRDFTKRTNEGDMSVFFLDVVRKDELQKTLSQYIPLSYNFIQCSEGTQYVQSLNQCQCAPGYEKTDAGCSKCQKNRYKKTVGDAEKCIKCPYKAYTDQQGATVCVCSEQDNLIMHASGEYCVDKTTNVRVKKPVRILGLAVFEFALICFALFAIILFVAWRRVKKWRRENQKGPINLGGLVKKKKEDSENSKNELQIQIDQSVQRLVQKLTKN